MEGCKEGVWGGRARIRVRVRVHDGYDGEQYMVYRGCMRVGITSVLQGPFCRLPS